jgi:hypothetical protein
MPPDHRVGLDQDEGLTPLGPEAIKGNPQESVHGPKRDSSSPGALENGELVAESRALDLQRGSRPKGRGQPGKQRYRHSTHDPRRQQREAAKTTVSVSTEFLAGTGWEGDIKSLLRS